jgi:hypothetical protein
MWTVEVHDEKLRLMRRTSLDAVNWNLPEPCDIIGLDKGRHPWHIDVIRDKGRLSALLISYLGPGHSGGEGSRIHYAYSEDEGLTWSAGGFLFEQVYEFESQLQYRGSLQLLDKERQVYGLWYSAASLTDMFSIGFLRMTRAEEGFRLCELEWLRQDWLKEVT